MLRRSRFWRISLDAPTVADAVIGITIAFPQRDVHLDTLSPLKVELSRARPMPQSDDETESPAKATG